MKFGKDNSFQTELRRRVDDFFKRTGRRQRDLPAMYLKSAVLITAFVAFYILLVFVVHTAWLALPLAALIGLAAAGIGFNIQHDGGHQAYSKHAWVNKIMSLSLDLIGGSSYLWHYKHGVYHHTYVNITHEDTDIDLGVLGRLSPHQKHYWFHRYQHLYIWPLYGLFVIKWHLFDDFKDLATGHIGQHRVPRPKGWDLVAFIAGKLFFLTLAFGVPLLFHKAWIVFGAYGVAVSVLGITLSVVFQLAHAVEEAEFPMPEPDTSNMENAWAIHQVQTTVNFARKSRLAAWMLGGLNYQVEHHLLPRICHINFPALSRIVEETCAEFGVKYNEHRTVFAGVASHFRWLRQMGAAPSAAI